ncbi:hypothetical protein SRHO_G00260100 [Serrasalmus rhombeus]
MHLKMACQPPFTQRKKTKKRLKLLVVLTLISDPFSERMRAECDAAQLSDDPRLLEPDHSSTKHMMFSLKSSPALSYQV